MRLPHFIIAGTQKGGTTWLEHNLHCHPQVFTPRRQIHYFDRNFNLGVEWYSTHFQQANENEICGEKTTEYFDTLHMDVVPARISETVPDTKIIIILRDPVDRAFSAFRHMVNAGLELLSDDPGQTIFDDLDRPAGKRWRYIERGFYARQLESFYRYIPREQILVLIYEEDVRNDPETCWTSVCSFIGIRHEPVRDLRRVVNSLRLSPVSIRLSRMLHDVPFARGAIRRVDRALALPHWNPELDDRARQRLRDLYQPHNRELFELIGRSIPAWG